MPDTRRNEYASLIKISSDDGIGSSSSHLKTIYNPALSML